jgi:large subunit ribosomal protein L19
MNIMDRIEKPRMRQDVPEFSVGDTVRVHVKIREGEKDRVQVFEGVVIRRRVGGINENFTVRRIASHGIGVERTFLIHSPRVDKVEVLRHGRVRRAKLYYLRGLTGRAARIKERRRPQPVTHAAPSVTAGAEEVLPAVEETEEFDELAAVEQSSSEAVEEGSPVDSPDEGEATS